MPALRGEEDELGIASSGPPLLVDAPKAAPDAIAQCLGGMQQLCPKQFDAKST